MKNLLFAVLIICIFSCKSQPKINSLLELSKDHKVVFLDSLAAAQAIIKDEKENFFTFINKLDMDIQMKRNSAPESTREEVLEEYKSFLKTDVLDFTKEEIEFVNKVFKEAYELCNKVSPNIFPKEIKLIKTHANHYGEGAYYTRENCIIIPKGQLKMKNYNSFLGTMFHEISHIYTRYNPAKRKALYKLIGFSNLGNPSNLLIKDALKKRILLNPDGINYAYSIDLKEKDGRKYSAIPIIASKMDQYDSDTPSFFGYLDFNLYKVRIQHAVNVITNSEGKTTVDMDHIPDFFEQITDNTGYIIHPDEIIADNFMYIMLRGKENGLNQNFSDPGVELLKNIKMILTN